jgi:hypothetical protein
VQRDGDSSLTMQQLQQSCNSLQLLQGDSSLTTAAGLSLRLVAFVTQPLRSSRWRPGILIICNATVQILTMENWSSNLSDMAASSGIGSALYLIGQYWYFCTSKASKVGVQPERYGCVERDRLRPLFDRSVLVLLY